MKKQRSTRLSKMFKTTQLGLRETKIEPGQPDCYSVLRKPRKEWNTPREEIQTVTLERSRHPWSFLPGSPSKSKSAMWAAFPDSETPNPHHALAGYWSFTEHIGARQGSTHNENRCHIIHFKPGQSRLKFLSSFQAGPPPLSASTPITPLGKKHPLYHLNLPSLERRGYT